MKKIERKEQKLFPLPPRQKGVLDFVVAFIAKNGYSPTEAEVAAGLKISIYNSKYVLSVLVEKGKIVRHPKNASRNIKVLAV